MNEKEKEKQRLLTQKQQSQELGYYETMTEPNVLTMEQGAVKMKDIAPPIEGTTVQEDDNIEEFRGI